MNTKTNKESKSKKRKIGVGEIAYRMINLGHNDDQIIALSRALFPDSKINEAHVRWYRARPHTKFSAITTTTGVK